MQGFASCDWLIWLIDWLINWLVDLSIGRLINWLIDWSIDWSIHWSIKCCDYFFSPTFKCIRFSGWESHLLIAASRHFASLPFLCYSAHFLKLETNSIFPLSCRAPSLLQLHNHHCHHPKSDLQLAFVWTVKIWTIKLIKHITSGHKSFDWIRKLIRQMDHKMCSPTAVVRRQR